ncbi:MAG: signal peptidase I [Lachnospiraceae bacterium]|nr:signal peptidase I [Lachnospiraceae bacterium]
MARRKGLSFYRRRKKVNMGIVREILGWLFGIAVSVFLAVVLVYFFGMTTYVVGSSMEQELYNGQEVLIDRFRYILSSPKAGDIVVFLPNGNEKAHYYIKRVVAVPGDEVLVQNGALYVNAQKSKWVDEKILDAGIAENLLTMEKGEYFCIGDNVNNSEDSRSANIGTVKDADMIGRVWFRKAAQGVKAGFVE